MITITRRMLVSAPRETVSLYLRDLANMRDYEQKVDEVEATYPDAQSGFVEVAGRFLGLPWRGAFSMRFTPDGGFRSEMVRGPLKRMVGGFHLRPVTGGTLLTHDEQYHFPWFVRPLAYLLRGRIGRTLERELEVIKEGAERLQRQRQLREIESAQLQIERR